MSWLLIFGTIIIIVPIAIYMKKRVPVSEIYITVLFGLFVQSLVDGFASYRYDAWGFFEKEEIEFKSLWIIITIYPTFAAMIINWFPFRGSWWRKIIYLIGWSAFSTFYEWLAVITNVMWHVNWNLLYSFILYPWIYYLLIIHVRFYRYFNRVIGGGT